MRFSALIQNLERIAIEPLLGLAVASTVICLIGSFASRLAYCRSAAFRFCIWQMVGLGILTSCVVLFTVPGIPLSTWATHKSQESHQQTLAGVSSESSAGETRTSGTSAPDTIGNEVASEMTITERAESVHIESKPTLRASFPAESMSQVLTASISVIWLGLVAFHMLVLAWSFRRAFSIASSHSEAATEQVNTALMKARHQLRLPSEHKVRTVVSSVAKIPLTIGVFRSTIVLPKCCGEWSQSKLEMVLLHELAHVERRDVFWQLLMRMACCVTWFNPLVWRAARNSIAERERACDDLVLSTGITAAAYGQSLVEIASDINSRIHALSGVVSMAEPPLQVRLKAILDKSIFRNPIRSRTRGAMATFFLACGFALGIIRPIANPVAAVSPSVTNFVPDTSLTSPLESAPVSETALLQAQEGVDGAVTGIIVRASDGSPVPDATVIIHTGRNNKTTSDAQGRFRLENIEPSSYAYRLWAYQGNLVSEAVEVKSAEAEDPKTAKFAPARVEMKEGRKVRFEVRSADTQMPLDGANVRFGYPDRRLATTDKDGIAMVEGLMPTWIFDGYNVTVECTEYARSAIQLPHNLSEPITEFKVALSSGGIVQGQVVDDEGQPLGDVGIVYRLANGSGFYGDVYRTKTDGKFLNRFLPLGEEIKISAEKNGYISEETRISLSEKQRESDLQFTLRSLPKGWSIVGQVVNEQDKPISNATVTNVGNSSNQMRDTKTDNEGRFALNNLDISDSNLRICVYAKGHSPQSFYAKRDDAGSPESIRVVMKPGRSIHGRIILENGQPAVGAVISARHSSFVAGLGESSTVDREGRFRLDSLPDDVRFDVTLKDHSGMYNVPLNMDEAKPISITLESPGIIRGLVTNAETKKPIRQFSVRLSFAQTRQPGDVQGTLGSTWSDSGVTFRSDDGRFSVKPLTNGMALDMIVEAEGHERLVLPRVVAAKDNIAQNVMIALRPKASVEPYMVSLLFRDETGNPIPNVQLRLIVSTQQPTGQGDNAFNWFLIESGQLGRKPYVDQYLSGTSDSEGNCDFRGVLPGKYLQLVYWGKGVPKQRSLAFDETRAGQSDKLILDVPRPSMVRATVDRSVFPNASSIRISGQADSSLNFSTQLIGDQSTFEFQDLPPGKFWISVDGQLVRRMENGYEMSSRPILASKELVLKAGEAKALHFDTPDPSR
jgi:beta-lactamase regulating signal transducer with metallopeptidase domain